MPTIVRFNKLKLDPNHTGSGWCEICKKDVNALQMRYEEVSDKEFEEIKAAQGKEWDNKLQREII